MYFENNNSALYSDTMIPDVFISEYLPSLDGSVVKVYLYIVYLGKHNKFFSPWEISKKLNMDVDKVKEAFSILESVGAICRDDKKTTLVDLKEKEIKKLYRLKTTSLPAEALANSEKNKKRNETIYAINENFFQGLMSPSWYTDIDAWFERYKFDEDVVYTLFQHCYDHNGLAKNYIEKVADSWFSKNIRNSLELDEYYMATQMTRDIRNKISKKLKLNRNLTQYEEDMVEKWCKSFNYDFDIIEIVLKRTTGKSSPNFNYINAVLTDWNVKGLKTKEEISEYTKSIDNKEYKPKVNKKDEVVPQYAKFTQREYSDDEFEKLYDNFSE